MLDEATRRRFWSKVEKTDSCWLWHAAKFVSGGYGEFYLDGKMARAHRVSWEMVHGPITNGLLVLHNCPDGDNPACVNPAHLWLGTDADNMADKVSKGRQPHGEEIRQGKLTREQALEVRARVAAGEPQCKVAKRFGIDPSSVSKLVSGQRWKYLDAEAR